MTLGRGARRLCMATSPASWRSANIFALTLDAAAYGGVLPTVPGHRPAQPGLRRPLPSIHTDTSSLMRVSRLKCEQVAQECLKHVLG